MNATVSLKSTPQCNYNKVLNLMNSVPSFLEGYAVQKKASDRIFVKTYPAAKRQRRNEIPEDLSDVLMEGYSSSKQ